MTPSHQRRKRSCDTEIVLCWCDTAIIVLLCCDTEIVLLCCFVALRDAGIVSDKYLFPLKIKCCIGMFDFIMRCFLV